MRLNLSGCLRPVQTKEESIGKRESQQEKHKEKQKQQKPKNDKNKDDSKNQDIEDE